MTLISPLILAILFRFSLWALMTLSRLIPNIKMALGGLLVKKKKCKAITLAAVVILIAVGLVLTGVMLQMPLLFGLGVMLGLAGIIGGIYYLVKRRFDLDLPSERNQVIAKIANGSLTFPKIVKDFTDRELVGYNLMRGKWHVADAAKYQQFLIIYSKCVGLNAQHGHDNNAITQEYAHQAAPHAAVYNQRVNQVHNRMAVGEMAAHTSHVFTGGNRRHEPNLIDAAAGINNIVGVGQNMYAAHTYENAIEPIQQQRDQAQRRARDAYAVTLGQLTAAHVNLV